MQASASFASFQSMVKKKNKAAQMLGRLGAKKRAKLFKHKDFVRWGREGGRGNKKK